MKNKTAEIINFKDLLPQKPQKERVRRPTLKYKKVILIYLYRWMQKMIVFKRMADIESWVEKDSEGKFLIDFDDFYFYEQYGSDPLSYMFSDVELGYMMLLSNKEKKVIRNFSKEETNAVYGEIKKNRKRKKIPDNKLMYGCILKNKGFLFDCGQCPYGMIHGVCRQHCDVEYEQAVPLGSSLSKEVGETELRKFLEIFFV